MRDVPVVEFLIRHTNGARSSGNEDEGGHTLCVLTRDFRITSHFETRTGADRLIMTFGTAPTPTSTPLMKARY